MTDYTMYVYASVEMFAKDRFCFGYFDENKWDQNDRYYNWFQDVARKRTIYKLIEYINVDTIEAETLYTSLMVRFKGKEFEHVHLFELNDQTARVDMELHNLLGYLRDEEGNIDDIHEKIQEVLL